MNAVLRARFGEVAEVHAAWPVAEPRPAVATHEAGLAHAAGAEHGDEAHPRVDDLREIAQVGDPSDECVAFGREVVADVAKWQPRLAYARDAIGLLRVGRWLERR